MLERRASLLCLLLGFFTYLIASVHALGGLAGKRSSVVKGLEPDYPESIRTWPKIRSNVVADIRIEDEGGGLQQNPRGRAALPLATPTFRPARTTSGSISGCSPTTTCLTCVVGRRSIIVNNNALLTISSLSSALASATASALTISQSMSQEFASSLEELQSSADLVAASASSALLVASSAVSAAQESAAQAISAAEESAAKAIAEATWSITGALAEATTTRTQAQQELEAAEGAAMSVTRAAVITVVSIVVAVLSAILGFYLFIRYRRAKRNRQQGEGGGREEGQEEKAQGAELTRQPGEQQDARRRQEQERDHELSATEALARAVVSYIEKEQMPTPITPATPAAVHLRPPASNITSPITLASPIKPASPASPVNVLSPVNSQQGRIGFAVGGEIDDPLWVQQHPPPSRPPPPTPVRSAQIRNTSSPNPIRRTPSNRAARRSDRNVYGNIITHPLETVPTNDSCISRCSGEESGQHRPEREEKRDSNWPLPKQGWL